MPVPGPVYETLFSSGLTVISDSRTGRAIDTISRLLLGLPDRRRLVSPGLASADIAIVDEAGRMVCGERRISMSRGGWYGYGGRQPDPAADPFSSFDDALDWIGCPSQCVPAAERDSILSRLTRTDDASTKEIVDALTKNRIIAFNAEGLFANGLLFLSPRCCLTSAYFRSCEPVRLCIRSGIFWRSILSLRPDRLRPVDGPALHTTMADVIAARLDMEQDVLSEADRKEIASNLARIGGRLDYLVPY